MNINNKINRKLKGGDLKKIVLFHQIVLNYIKMMEILRSHSPEANNNQT